MIVHTSAVGDVHRRSMGAFIYWFFVIIFALGRWGGGYCFNSSIRASDLVQDAVLKLDLTTLLRIAETNVF